MPNGKVSFSETSFSTAAQKAVNVLVVEGIHATPESPVLLFLHGRGEASEHATGLPLVLRNMAPGYQVIQERLKQATVVSPQVPTGGFEWDWRDYVPELGAFLRQQFGGRTILASGFSRGGRGVLQLVARHDGLISRWAIVDPQRADSDEEARLLPAGPNAAGWLRFGNGLPQNTPFAVRLSQRLIRTNTAFVDLGHGALAVAAFSGEKLHGSIELRETVSDNQHLATFAIGADVTPAVKAEKRQNMYEYLGIA